MSLMHYKYDKIDAMLKNREKHTSPEGFLFSAGEAAIKKPGRKDIAIIYSRTEANIAGAFATNRAKAAPVKLDMEKIKSGRGQNNCKQRKCKCMHRQEGMQDADGDSFAHGKKS